MIVKLYKNGGDVNAINEWLCNDLSPWVKFVFQVLLANAVPAITILMTIPHMTDDAYTSCRGEDPDQDFVRFWGRFRDLPQLEYLRRTVSFIDNGFHESPPLQIRPLSFRRINDDLAVKPLR